MGAIKINGSTSGSTTITAPATGSDETIELFTALAGKLPIAGGKILQIVRATDGTDRSTTSATYVDASNSVTITPQKSDSAILIVASFFAGVAASGGGYTGWTSKYQITDASNNAISGAEDCTQGAGLTSPTATAPIMYTAMTIVGYATPATTSATTYKLRFRSSLASFVTAHLYNSATTGQMYAIEVSA